MELMSAIVVGVLFATGVYLMLQGRLLRVVIGTALLSHGVNLMLLQSGRLKRGGAPIITETHEASHGIVQSVATVDPLPQALILTAIVIGFATTAFVIILAYRMYQEKGTDDLTELRGLQDE